MWKLGKTRLLDLCMHSLVGIIITFRGQCICRLVLVAWFIIMLVSVCSHLMGEVVNFQALLHIRY